MSESDTMRHKIAEKLKNDLYAALRLALRGTSLGLRDKMETVADVLSYLTDEGDSDTHTERGIAVSRGYRLAEEALRSGIASADEYGWEG